MLLYCLLVPVLRILSLVPSVYFPCVFALGPVPCFVSLCFKACAYAPPPSTTFPVPSPLPPALSLFLALSPVPMLRLLFPSSWPLQEVANRKHNCTGPKDKFALVFLEILFQVSKRYIMVQRSDFRSFIQFY